MLTRMRKKKNANSERRPAINKQIAFKEFKATEEAVIVEKEILECRANLKARRSELSGKTEQVNMIKREIDHVKAYLDEKNEEKTKNAMH